MAQKALTAVIQKAYVQGLRNRLLEGDRPYLWIDATYVKVRQNNHIASVAAIFALAVNSDGRREVPGLDIGACEAEPFWAGFLRKLTRRGLRPRVLDFSEVVALADFHAIVAQDAVGHGHVEIHIGQGVAE